MPKFIVHQTVYVCQESQFEADSLEDLVAHLQGTYSNCRKPSDEYLLEESIMPCGTGDFVIYDEEGNEYTYYDGLLQGDEE